jgi:hypothetical protein
VQMTDTPAPPKKRKGPGRPPRDKKAASERFELRATGAELRAWKRAAGAKSVSEWIRGLANEAAARVAQ